MYQIIRHLKKNWIKYGFETVAIIFGIIGAFALSNWHEKRVERKKELIYMVNLKDELSMHLNIIDWQREFDLNRVGECKRILQLINKAPYDTEGINELLTSGNRKSFVINTSVFEDLKFTGNLSLIRDIAFRNEIINYYQYVAYVETIIENGNNNWVDWIGQYIVESSISDFSRSYGDPETSNSPALKDVDPFPGSDRIMKSQLENELLRFGLFNKISLRGRISNNSINHLNNLEDECKSLIQIVEGQL